MTITELEVANEKLKEQLVILRAERNTLNRRIDNLERDHGFNLSRIQELQRRERMESRLSCAGADRYGRQEFDK